jgi:hypothetical protein
MRGQWLGTYTGTNSGTATVDVDEIGNRFRGYAYLFENNPALQILGQKSMSLSLPAIAS